MRDLLRSPPTSVTVFIFSEPSLFCTLLGLCSNGGREDLCCSIPLSRTERGAKGGSVQCHGRHTFRSFNQAGKMKQIFSFLLDVGVMWEPPVLHEGQGTDHLIKGRNKTPH